VCVAPVPVLDSPTMLVLYARDGWGSVLIEAQLDWYGLEYRRELVGDLLGSEQARAALAPVNPISQVPTLRRADGEVLTESVAITLYLSEMTGRNDFVPAPGEPTRAAFLRWLVFLATNVYPTFTYADLPSRFVAVEAAQAPFRAAVDEYARRLWKVVGAAAGEPWFLGSRFSAIDIYIAVMTRWRPGRDWFKNNTERLHAIAHALDSEARLAGAWRRNFDKGI
jgi:GST-like protein